jgi:hypothetical protein
MIIFNVYRNGEFQLCCHADDEQNAIDTAIRRMGFPMRDIYDAEWSAEAE